MSRDAFGQLQALYRELDHALAELSPVCAGCGECCRFETADHILYASRLEREYLLTAPATPVAEPADLLAQGLRCPYQDGPRCLARDHRPLGCRLHFCRWPEGSGADEEEFCEAWHGRLKQLHREAGVEWRYAPLLESLCRKGFDFCK